MLKHESLDSLNIFVFANSLIETPPRKFHLNDKLADSWDIMKREIAKFLFPQILEDVSIYTLDGILVAESLYLIHNNAYVAVPVGDEFVQSNYKTCLLKIIRLRNKYYNKENSDSIEISVNDIFSPQFSDSVVSSDDQDSRIYDKDHGDSGCDEYLVEDLYSSFSDTSLYRLTVEVTDIECMESATDSSMDSSHLCQCQARREQVEELVKRVEVHNSVQKQEAAQKICHLQNKLTDIADEMNTAFEMLLDGPVEATYAVTECHAADAAVGCNMFGVSHTSRAVHLEHYIQYQIKKYMDESKINSDSSLAEQRQVTKLNNDINQTDNKEKGDVESMEKLSNDLLRAAQSECECARKMEVPGTKVQTVGFFAKSGSGFREKMERGVSASDIKDSVYSLIQKMTQTSRCTQSAEISEPNDKTHYLIRVTPELEKYVRWQLQQYIKYNLEKSESPPDDAKKLNAPSDTQEPGLETYNDNVGYVSHKQNIEVYNNFEQNVQRDTSGCQHKNNDAPCQNLNKPNNRYHLCACVDVCNLYRKKDASISTCATFNDGGDRRYKTEGLSTPESEYERCMCHKNSFLHHDDENNTISPPLARSTSFKSEEEVPRRATARLSAPKKKSLICGSCCSCRPPVTSPESIKSDYQLSSVKTSKLTETVSSGLRGPDVGTQTSWSNMLLIPKLQEDGHYELHIPPLDMVNYPTGGAEHNACGIVQSKNAPRK